MENLHFDKGGYFYELFFNRNRKYFPLCSHTVKKHVLKFGRSQNTENSVATLAMWEWAISTCLFFQTSTCVSITVCLTVWSPGSKLVWVVVFMLIYSLLVLIKQIKSIYKCIARNGASHWCKRRANSAVYNAISLGNKYLHEEENAAKYLLNIPAFSELHSKCTCIYPSST